MTRLSLGGDPAQTEDHTMLAGDTASASREVCDGSERGPSRLEPI